MAHLIGGRRLSALSEAGSLLSRRINGLAPPGAPGLHSFAPVGGGIVSRILTSALTNGGRAGACRGSVALPERARAIRFRRVRGHLPCLVRVAQLDRVSASEAEGCWFEPSRGR